MEKFMTGNSVVYGNLVCKPAQLSEVTEKLFYKELDNSLKKNNFEEHRKTALNKTALKIGITIGNEYYIITKK